MPGPGRDTGGSRVHRDGETPGAETQMRERHRGGKTEREETRYRKIHEDELQGGRDSEIGRRGKG